MANTLDHPKFGCCGDSCKTWPNGVCKCCCENVVYTDGMTMTLNLAVGDPDVCGFSRVTASIPLTDIWSVFHPGTAPDPETGDPGTPPFWGPFERHPCEYIWHPHFPPNDSGATCGDVTMVIPTDQFGSCVDVTWYLSFVTFQCVCQSAGEICPIGAGSTPAFCTVSSGESNAGWQGAIAITTNSDCGSPFGATFNLNLFSCANGSVEGLCDPCGPSWTCCPFYQKYYLGVWHFPPNGDDSVDCEAGTTTIDGVVYNLADLSYVEITAPWTCRNQTPPMFLDTPAPAPAPKIAPATRSRTVRPDFKMAAKMKSSGFIRRSLCPNCGAVMCCGHAGKCPKRRQ